MLLGIADIKGKDAARIIQESQNFDLLYIEGIMNLVEQEEIIKQSDAELLEKQGSVINRLKPISTVGQDSEVTTAGMGLDDLLLHEK